MLSPSLALLVSIVGIIVLLRLRVHVGFAIFAGSLVLSLLVLPLTSTPALMRQTLLNYETVRLLVIIASALTLSRLMEERGLLAKLAVTLESIGPKLALHFVPAVIGLVPMPAGALVSATTVRGLVAKLGLNAEQSTFINYWFRHIWEFALPMYPAIVLASVVLSIPLSSLVVILLPMTPLTIVCGGSLSYAILKRIPRTRARLSKGIVYDFLKASWPILLLVPSILLGLEAMIAFPLVLALLALQQRARWPELKKALKYGLDPKILLMLYAVMLYTATIESSKAALAFFSDMQAIGLPTVVILAVLPFTMGIATGFGPASIGVTFPLLAPYILSGTGINTHALLVGYTSGLAGVLLSPVHLCLVLSAEYFKASLAKVYQYIVPPVLVIEAIAILIYYAGGRA